MVYTGKMPEKKKLLITDVFCSQGSLITFFCAKIKSADDATIS